MIVIRKNTSQIRMYNIVHSSIEIQMESKSIKYHKNKNNMKMITKIKVDQGYRSLK